MMTFRNTAIMLVMAMAGVAQASTISIVDLGSPDTSGFSGGVHTELQKYRFTVAKTTETSNINAVDIKVTTTSGELHQIWGETVFFGSYTYTASPARGNINVNLQAAADTYLFDSIFTLNVVPPSEDMATIVDGNNGTSSYTGPASLIDPEVSAFGFQAGFGSSFEFVGAVPVGSEKTAYTVLQIVVPSSLAGTVTVHIEATAPGAQINIQEFVLGDTGPGPGPEIPEPATLSMIGLGGLLLMRRRRTA